MIDTHEHLPWVEYPANPDLLSDYLSAYMSSDLISAGLKREDLEKAVDPNRSVMERWRIVEPFWAFCRLTGYGRSLDIAVREIYEVDQINDKTIEKLSALYKDSMKPGHAERVLGELCNIETSLVDVWPFMGVGENGIYKRVWSMRDFIMASPSRSDHVLSYREGSDMLGYIQRKYAIPVNSLGDWLIAIEMELEAFIDQYGVRVLKNGLAYERTLRFEQVSYVHAKSLFDEAMKQKGQLAFPIELQDFMMHYVLQLANEHGLTMQIHTGLLEGNGNVLTNSDPSLLIPLFAAYPNVDFDLFHISYPYQQVACALGKTFSNVFVDMCWAHIISPSASVVALDDFLDAMPYNKISAFGGDYGFVDGVCGHLYVSRENVSRTLAGKVERGAFSERKALDIAKALYYDNPKRIFKL